MRRALVRPPGARFAEALSQHPDRDTIDPDRAKAQHANYRATLSALGVEVQVLPPDDEYPDACFVQDLAIVLDDRALLCRPGAESRQPEPDGIKPMLVESLSAVEKVEPPATIEGGDVVRVGDRFVVGRSERTNEEGIRALERFVAPEATVVNAEVREPFLHLLSGLSVAGNAVVGSHALIEQRAFTGLERVPIPDDEATGCNFVVIDRDVVMGAGYPAVRRALEDRGFRVQEVDLSEFAKADGGPTCLSLLL